MNARSHFTPPLSIDFSISRPRVSGSVNDSKKVDWSNPFHLKDRLGEGEFKSGRIFSESTHLKLTSGSLISLHRAARACRAARGRYFGHYDQTLDQHEKEIQNIGRLRPLALTVDAAAEVAASNLKYDCLALLYVLEGGDGSWRNPHIIRSRVEDRLTSDIRQSVVQHEDHLFSQSCDAMRAALAATASIRNQRDKAAEALRVILDNFITLMRELDAQIRPGTHFDNPLLLFAASLIAEFTYYQVLPEELDLARQRVKIFVPSEAFKDLLLASQSVNVSLAGGEDVEGGAAFVVDTGNTLAVAVKAGSRVYIGFRGTIFSYLGDWKTNLNDRPRSWPRAAATALTSGSYHAGFLSETFRICSLLLPELWRRRLNDREIVLCGHSLGGAIASVAQLLFLNDNYKRVRTASFGAPRFCDRSAYTARGIEIPFQVRRRGDMVPRVPPRFTGYADPTIDYWVPPGRPKHPWIPDEVHWGYFVGTLAKNHNVERYRIDLTPVGFRKLGPRLGGFTEIKAADLR